MGIDMNDIEIKVGDKLIHRTTSKVIIVLGFIEKKNLKRQSKTVEVLHGRTEKVRMALWSIKKNYIPYEARLDTRLNAEIVTPVGSQWIADNGDILKVYSIHKHECTFDDVRFKLYTPRGVCIGGGSRSPESILDNYKPLNANRDFVGEFQKALTGETVSETTVAQSEPVMATNTNEIKENEEEVVKQNFEKPVPNKDLVAYSLSQSLSQQIRKNNELEHENKLRNLALGELVNFTLYHGSAYSKELIEWLRLSSFSHSLVQEVNEVIINEYINLNNNDELEKRLNHLKEENRNVSKKIGGFFDD